MLFFQVVVVVVKSNYDEKKKLPILSQAGRTRYIAIGINPASTKMIDGTEKPKIPTKFAKRAARYNEFRCNNGFQIPVKTSFTGHR